MTNYVTGDIFVSQPPHQTLAAWEPFNDCVSILFHFQNSDFVDGDDELHEWRLYWVAGVTLLRTIGHVLAKVDEKSSPVHAKTIRLLWNRLQRDRKSSAIFWDFIEDERNNLLKTYSFGARLTRDERGAYIAFKDGSNAFELFRQAVYWWRYHLTALELEILA
jgi:hypothetical protein